MYQVITVNFLRFYTIIFLVHDNFALKSDSHVQEKFCQIKISPTHVRKNTMICLFGV